MKLVKLIKSVCVTGAVMFSALTMAGQPVDVNTADAALIAKSLDGVGPVKSAAIVKYRKENGPYKTLADVDKVRGIGPRTLENNKAYFLGLSK
jgi:competence protein ComEA